MTGSSCKYAYYEYDHFKNFFMLFERLAEITVNAAIENVGPMYVCVCMSQPCTTPKPFETSG